MRAGFLITISLIILWVAFGDTNSRQMEINHNNYAERKVDRWSLKIQYG